MSSLFQYIDPAELLKITGGLNFLLALLSCGLIFREQTRRGEPRPAILWSIYIFIAANLISLGLSFFASSQAHQATQLQTLTTKLEQANSKISVYKEANIKVKGVASTLTRMLEMKLLIVEDDGRNDPEEKKTIKEAIAKLNSEVQTLSSIQ